eukprot:comp68067_c0_seq1/m.48063 comp68067_c0_seq1/g.48063  ORF comp68067_c0_seq1/g.48063 comp68067_c0_seq1/m.48063 type:complete len:150 (-) comp68067_c0_seq1:453-902(-)
MSSSEHTFAPVLRAKQLGEPLERSEPKNTPSTATSEKNSKQDEREGDSKPEETHKEKHQEQKEERGTEFGTDAPVSEDMPEPRAPWETGVHHYKEDMGPYAPGQVTERNISPGEKFAGVGEGSGTVGSNPTDVRATVWGTGTTTQSYTK